MGERACESEFVGDKRDAVESRDLFDEEKKMIKMQDLKFLSCSEEVANRGCSLSQEDMPRVTEESFKINSDAVHLARTSKEVSPVLIRCDANVVDVNKKADVKFNPQRASVQSVVGVDRALLSRKEFGGDNVTRKEIGFVTEKDVAYSSSTNPFYPCKKVSREQCVEMSECGSVTGPPEPKDSMAVWKEMKQNGFLSSSHSHKVVSVLPVKSRIRKSKADVAKKKMEQARIELAKKEQIDMFTKIAAPSGLLDKLNPGIINHVRNSKQVHSILKALVRPEGQDARTRFFKETELYKSNNIGFGQHAIRENGFGNFSASAHGRMTIGNPPFMDNSRNIMREKDVGLEDHVDTEIVNSCKNTNFRFLSTENTMENISSVSNSDNPNSISSLSAKAATVASQWLELLQHDIKGRLTALRRSKRRVCAVLETELPLLLSKEFPSNQENELDVVKSPTPVHQISTAELHEARWKALFGNMDTTLTDEEQQLESLLQQVRDMQLLCDKGLYREKHGVTACLQSLQGSEGDLRSKMENSDMELAVRAAAASIYSTCNFLMEKENIGCSQTR